MVSHFQPTDTGFLEHIQFSLITSCFLILVQPSQYLGFYPLFCPPCKPLPSAMSSLQAPSPIGPLPPIRTLPPGFCASPHSHQLEGTLSIPNFP